MTVGERVILSLHPDYAFGRGGRPPIIPPNTWLVYDLELLNIVGMLHYKVILSLHPDYAFGRGGRPPIIPPNTWLVYDLELLNIIGK